MKKKLGTCSFPKYFYANSQDVCCKMYVHTRPEIDPEEQDGGLGLSNWTNERYCRRMFGRVVF